MRNFMRCRRCLADERGVKMSILQYLNSKVAGFCGGRMRGITRSSSNHNSNSKSKLCSLTSRHNCLVQFWGAVKVEGRHHYLSPSHYSFFVSNLRKGHSWFRKVCVDYVYVVDVDGGDQPIIGGVGRAYRNKRSESSPDLKLYTTSEFPLRDEAARCGFADYMTFPLFYLHTGECYGVLEILSHLPKPFRPLLPSFNPGLQIPTEPKSGTTEILELAIRAVPQLSLVQVWVPCKECPTMRSSKHCVEMTSFITAQPKRVVSAWYETHDLDISNYIQACDLHNLQVYHTCFFRNISDLSISKSPLAHYANKARLSHCFTICLQSVDNSSDPFVIIQFYLQLENREKSLHASSLSLLLRIIVMKLKSYKLVSIEQLPKEIVVQLMQPNAIECESFDMLNVRMNFNERFSVSEFTAYLGALCCQRPSFGNNHGGWVFCSLVGEKPSESNGKKTCWMVPSLIKEKIEQFMKIIAAGYSTKHFIMQFWFPKMVEDRYYLETLDQPYIVGSLEKDLASFRKECTLRRYFVDEEAKEEAFKNEYPEYTNDLHLYSAKEFLMRNYAVHCNLRGYFALPVFDKEEQKCVGVLEFLDTFHIHGLYGEEIERALDFSITTSAYFKFIVIIVQFLLQTASLSSSRIQLHHPSLNADNVPSDVNLHLSL